MVNPKILCVDDEPNILDGLKRQLRGQFDVDTATSGADALKCLSNSGPYDVVVSDMRMPGMDGVEFLGKVKEVAPHTVRLMLTGNADQESAVRAVNEGNIFRFLNKPCSTEDLSKALNDAVEQHRLIVSEKDLLQNTLSGSVKLLTDILSFMDPASFGQSLKLRPMIQKIAPTLGVTNTWDVELASMLSNIGFVTVPSNVTAKFSKGHKLSPQESELLQKVPSIGQSLIKNIPRLEGVAKIVLYQNKHFDGTGAPADNIKGVDIPIGARIIKVLKDLSQLQTDTCSTKQALQIMIGRRGWYDPKILEAVSKFSDGVVSSVAAKSETKIYEITSNQLFVGQTLISNIETSDGVLLISAGSTISETLLERLRNYSKFVGIKEPIQVDCLIPIKE